MTGGLLPLVLGQGNVTPPEGFGSWLAGTFYAVGLVAACVLLWRQINPRPQVPQPLTVRPEADLVTRREHEELRVRVASIEARIDDRFRDAAVASAASRKGMYELLRAQGERLSAVEAMTGATHAHVQQVVLKLDRVVERLSGERTERREP